ncbi:hypothetical protein ACIPYS_06625 [Kitasatospora sp. NPDC089913]|uniref:hypothetical protein n=1 Tax=Streptomycetaceae TaxID=2062 RepID=UPI00087B6C58|nr:hypothetical protein [Streptomyces sp. TLI_053]SDT82487.1 hypothetical protein SAMN05216371_7272 [Streptomyces sp. TLI_053]
MTDTVLRQAALWVTVLGAGAAVLAGLRLRRVRPAVTVLSDFLLAAGLIHLAGRTGWTSLALVASVGALRIVLDLDLRALAGRPRKDAAAPPTRAS